MNISKRYFAPLVVALMLLSAQSVFAAPAAPIIMQLSENEIVPNIGEVVMVKVQILQELPSLAITVKNQRNQVVKTLMQTNTHLLPGKNIATNWNGRSVLNGNPVPAGIYSVVITSGGRQLASQQIRVK